MRGERERGKREKERNRRGEEWWAQAHDSTKNRLKDQISSRVSSTFLLTNRRTDEGCADKVPHTARKNILISTWEHNTGENTPLAPQASCQHPDWKQIPIS
jgi:hypothetical protein